MHSFIQIMKKNILPILLVTITLGSCTKEKIHVDPDNPLLGTWIFSDYRNDAFIFERSTGFTENHCYRFNSDGTMTERKNSGWCGTPPISYADFDGTWSEQDDTLKNVTVGYWGGKMNYAMDIFFVDQNSLEVRYIYPEEQ